MNRKGFYCNLIGADGSGKDTIYQMLIREFPNAIQMREPGGCEESERIRDVLLSIEYESSDRIRIIQSLLDCNSATNLTKNYLEQAKKIIKKDGLNGYAEAYLYAASRAQTNETIIQPAVKSGLLVLGRRSVACSMAYQGYARNIGMDFVWDLNKRAIAPALPDLEIYLDVPFEVAIERIKKRTEKQDRLDLETSDFHRKSIEGYKTYYQTYCPYRYVYIDAAKSIEEVYNQVMIALNRHFA